MLNSSRAFVTPNSSNASSKNHMHVPSSVDWQRPSSTSSFSNSGDSDYNKVQLLPQTQHLVKKLKRQTQRKDCVIKNKKNHAQSLDKIIKWRAENWKHWKINLISSGSKMKWHRKQKIKSSLEWNAFAQELKSFIKKTRLSRRWLWKPKIWKEKLKH